MENHTFHLSFQIVFVFPYSKVKFTRNKMKVLKGILKILCPLFVELIEFVIRKFSFTAKGSNEISKERHTAAFDASVLNRDRGQG